MAAVNRFTQIQPAQYNPMSLQELMLAPQYKRTQHDNLLQAGSTMNEELMKVDPLDIHSDVARQEQERIGNNIQSQVDMLAKEGFNPNSKQAFFDLNKQYNQAIAPTGTLGKVNMAKKTLAANRKAHIDAAVKEGFTMDQALQNWQQHEQKYVDEFKATGEIKEIGSLGNPKYVDYLDESMKLFKDAGFTERDLAGGAISQIITNDPRGQYILNTSGGKITRTNKPQLEKAVAWLNNNIANPNSEIGQSIAYQGKNPNQVLQEIGNLANVYLEDSQKNDYSATITGFKSNSELGINLPGNSAHTTREATNVKRFNENFNKTLSNILDGENTAGKVGYKSGVGMSPGTSINFKDSEKATPQNSMSDTEREQYNRIYNVLNRNGNEKALLHQLDKYHPDVIKEVQNYITKYSDLPRQDVIIRNDVVKYYGESTGINSKAAKDIDQYIKDDRLNRVYSYKGKEYKYNELIEEGIVFDEKAVYNGYMSPRNFGGYNKDSNKDLYVSPHVYTVFDPETKEGVEILVGRDSGERSEPEFKADRLYNTIYQKTISIPNETFTFPQLNSTIRYNPDNPTMPYIVKSLSTGLEEAYDDTTLQNKIYLGYKQNN